MANKVYKINGWYVDEDLCGHEYNFPLFSTAESAERYLKRVKELFPKLTTHYFTLRDEGESVYKYLFYNIQGDPWIEEIQVRD